MNRVTTVHRLYFVRHSLYSRRAETLTPITPVPPLQPPFRMAANVAIPLEQPQIKVAPPPAAGSPGSWLWTPEYVGSRVFASGPAMPTNDNSWEARAFMEDSNSLEAGIWPPRSYRCSFCRREFRCAQALGGHMNVHRRDRARLRQSSPLLGSDSDSASALTPLPVSAPAASADADHAQKLGLLHPISTDSLYKLMSFAVPITTFLSTPSLISTSSTSSILASAPVLPASNYQHPDGVSSLPLRLQRLASEAASTQSERSHFFSLGPPPTWPISHIANSVNVPIAATPASSSATSPPSIATTTRCRRQASLNQLKSESPRKKSAASGFQPYELSINKNSSQPANTADNAQLHTTERLNLVDNSHSELNDSNAAGGLDLELRLGQTSA